MNPRVRSVEPLADLRLRLSFQEGREAVFDVRPLLQYPVYHCLKDPAIFASARAAHGTVEWTGGLDVDPDTLYLESR